MILLANEFLDALPIRQFVRRGAGWTERFVAAGQWAEQPADAAEVPAGRAAAEGDIVEVNEPARALSGRWRLGWRAHAGAALFLDYGPAHSAAGDSLQALAQKRPVDPLVHAGSADLTAHVDFADLARWSRARAGPACRGRCRRGRSWRRSGCSSAPNGWRGSGRRRGGGADRGGAAAGGTGGDGASFQSAWRFVRPGCPPLPGFRHLIAPTSEAPPCSLPCS